MSEDSVRVCQWCKGRYTGNRPAHLRSEDHARAWLAVNSIDTLGVVRDYQSGEKLTTIQDRYNVLPPKVYDILRYAGVPLREKGANVSMGFIMNRQRMQVREKLRAAGWQ